MRRRWVEHGTRLRAPRRPKRHPVQSGHTRMQHRPAGPGLSHAAAQRTGRRPAKRHADGAWPGPEPRRQPRQRRGPADPTDRPRRTGARADPGATLPVHQRLGWAACRTAPTRRTRQRRGHQQRPAGPAPTRPKCAPWSPPSDVRPPRQCGGAAPVVGSLRGGQVGGGGLGGLGPGNMRSIAAAAAACSRRHLLRVTGPGSNASGLMPSESSPSVVAPSRVTPGSLARGRRVGRLAGSLGSLGQIHGLQRGQAVISNCHSKLLTVTVSQTRRSCTLGSGGESQYPWSGHYLSGSRARLRQMDGGHGQTWRQGEVPGDPGPHSQTRRPGYPLVRSCRTCTRARSHPRRLRWPSMYEALHLLERGRVEAGPGDEYLHGGSSRPGA